MSVRTMALVIAALAVATGTFLYSLHLRKQRVDVDPNRLPSLDEAGFWGEKSPLNPASYTGEGRIHVKWLWLGTLVAGLLVLLAVATQ